VTEALKLPAGVAIVKVVPGGPAERAGLAAFARRADGAVVAGDVITAIDDSPLRSFDDLLMLLEQHQPGDDVTLSVWRAGRSRKLKLRLAEGE